MRRSLKEYKIGIIGATGLVGREFLKILEEYKIPIENIKAIASEKSVGKVLKYLSGTLKVEGLNDFLKTKSDFAFLSAGSQISEEFAPIFADKGMFVVDNSSFFRMHENIPLVVPEINAPEILKAKNNIIANPNCSTIQLVVVLSALVKLCKIKRVIASTYQSTSGAGNNAVEELSKQIKSIQKGEGVVTKFLPKQIAFNIVPQIDIFLDNGITKEEWKMQVETKKILSSDVELSVTCVRVPVITGHSISVNVEFEDDFGNLEDVYAELEKADSIILEKKQNIYNTPIEIAGTDKIYVSRLRRDFSVKNGIQMWIVSDNVRKGAALNAIQIAEKIIEFGLL